MTRAMNPATVQVLLPTRTAMMLAYGAEMPIDLNQPDRVARRGWLKRRTDDQHA